MSFSVYVIHEYDFSSFSVMTRRFLDIQNIQNRFKQALYHWGHPDKVFLRRLSDIMNRGCKIRLYVFKIAVESLLWCFRSNTVKKRKRYKNKNIKQQFSYFDVFVLRRHVSWDQNLVRIMCCIMYQRQNQIPVCF